MNGNEQKQALEAIRLMLGARLNSQSSIGPETVKGYLMAVSDCTLLGVQRACEGFLKGNVIDFNNDFAPTGPRLAEEARKWDEAQAAMDRLVSADRPKLVTYPMGSLPPPPMVPAGLMTIDFGDGEIDMSKLSHAEQEEVLRLKGRPMMPTVRKMP